MNKRTIRTVAGLGLVVMLVASGCGDDGLDLCPTLPVINVGGVGAGGGNGSGNSGNGQSGMNVGAEGGMTSGGEGGEGGLNGTAGDSMTMGGTSAGMGGVGGTSTAGTAGSGGTTGGTMGNTAGTTGGGSGGSGTNAVCGNSKTEAGEECDDGNKLSGDGCSNKCLSKCELCQRDTCPTESTFPTIAATAFTKAFGIAGDAMGGPAINTPRVDLVRDMIECFYESKCLIISGNGTEPYVRQISMRACACLNPSPYDDAFPPACNTEATRMDGPCLKEMMEAAEADTFFQMNSKLKNPTLPSGVVNNLLTYCGAKVCTEECLPTELDVFESRGTGGMGGTGGTGGTSGTAGAGGSAGSSSGGTAGAAGSGGTAGGGAGGIGGSSGSGGTGGGTGTVCGNNVMEGVEECEFDGTPTPYCSDACTKVLSEECETCEQAPEQEFTCRRLATACTAATGIHTPADTAACYDVIDCVMDTGCGNGGAKLTECFCGNMPLLECQSAPDTGPNAPAGVCASVIRGAFVATGQTGTNAQVLEDFLDQSTAPGAGLRRLNCLTLPTTCAAQCFAP
jgi:cysteine-rich repeat protein